MDGTDYSMSVLANKQSNLQRKQSSNPKDDDQRKLRARNEGSADTKATHSSGEPVVTLRNSEDTKQQMDDSMDVDDEECNYSENCPYVPMNVEEVSIVKSLKHWTNPKVRVIGKFISENSNYTLWGAGKDCGEINLNVENLDQYPRHGEILEVFGFLYKDRQHTHQNTGHSVQESKSLVKLKVMFCRPILDVHKNQKALSLVKSYIPLFVRRNVN